MQPEPDTGTAPAGTTVSVIVLSYERPEWCEQAVRSVLAQTYRDIDVIVSDDSRTDDVRRMVERLGDPRVRYVRGPREGQLRNFRSSLREVRGELVTVLHDDDAWSPELLERLCTPMLGDPTLDLACCALDIVDADGAPLDTMTKHRRTSPGFDQLPTSATDLDFDVRARLALVHRALSPFQGTVVRRRCIAGIDIPDAAGSVVDYWICAHLVKTAARWLYVPEGLMSYRVHGGSVATSMNDLTAVRWCVAALVADPAFARVAGDLRRRLRDYERNDALAVLALGRRREARATLRSLAPQFDTRARVVHELITHQPFAFAVTRWLWHRNPRYAMASAAREGAPRAGGPAQ